MGHERYDNNMNVVVQEPEVIAPLEDNELYDPVEMGNIKQLQEIRLKIIKNVMGDSGSIPGDQEDRQFLATMMRDYENSANNRAKIKATQKIGSGIGDLTTAIGDALKRHRVTTPDIAPAERRQLPDSIRPTIVPGGMDVGTKIISYTEILDVEENA